MTKPISATNRGLRPHWKVRIIIGGAIIHTASWNQPVPVGLHQQPSADWVNDSAYGDVLGPVDWNRVDAITWRWSE